MSPSTTTHPGCTPVEPTLCGDQGTIVTATAYLDAHYQLEPGMCNRQVGIPWVWNVRFAAELTYQSATKALQLSQGSDYTIPPGHHFACLYECWRKAIEASVKNAKNEQSMIAKANNVTQHWTAIDKADPDGLMLRYPLGHPDKNASPIPQGLSSTASGLWLAGR